MTVKDMTTAFLCRFPADAPCIFAPGHSQTVTIFLDTDSPLLVPQRPMPALALTEASFEAALQNKGLIRSTSGRRGAGPAALAPIFEAAAERHPGVLFYKIDTEAEPANCRLWNFRHPHARGRPRRQPALPPAGRPSGRRPRRAHCQGPSPAPAPSPRADMSALPSPPP